MSNYQQRALVPFFFSVDHDITATVTDYVITGSAAAFASYQRSYFGGAVARACQMTVHEIKLGVTDIVTATSVPLAIVDADGGLSTPLTTVTIAPKPGATTTGTVISMTPYTGFFSFDSNGDLLLRLSTNAGTLTVMSIAMVCEFHAP